MHGGSYGADCVNVAWSAGQYLAGKSAATASAVRVLRDDSHVWLEGLTLRDNRTPDVERSYLDASRRSTSSTITTTSNCSKGIGWYIATIQCWVNDGRYDSFDGEGIE